MKYKMQLTVQIKNKKTLSNKDKKEIALLILRDVTDYVYQQSHKDECLIVSFKDIKLL